MNLGELRILDITRIVAHTVHPKTADNDAYASYGEECLRFTGQEKGTLIGRLYDALGNPKKTFKLAYEDRAQNDIYRYIHTDQEVADHDFVQCTQNMTDTLAGVHFRTNIPGGYCLFGEGITVSRKKFFFVIKAELQEVFSIDENVLVVVQNVFLSPAKELHKIGFFLEEDEGQFTPYMYDDQFSMQKKDLTEYFYNGFLGLSTDRNDSIRSKNFYKDTKKFIDENVANVRDQIGLYGALNTLFREDARGIVSAQEFSETYFEDRLKRKFDQSVVDAYPQAFTKDITLFEKTLQMDRISIPLTYTTKIVGTVATIDEIEVIEDEERINEIQQGGIVINNRRLTKVVLISTPNEEE